MFQHTNVTLLSHIIFLIYDCLNVYNNVWFWVFCFCFSVLMKSSSVRLSGHHPRYTKIIQNIWWLIPCFARFRIDSLWDKLHSATSKDCCWKKDPSNSIKWWHMIINCYLDSLCNPFPLPIQAFHHRCQVGKQSSYVQFQLDSKILVGMICDQLMNCL